MSELLQRRVLYQFNMTRRKKRIREKGKLRFSGYFKKIDDNSNVAVVVENCVRCSFPKRLGGMSGKILGSRGKFNLVEIKDGNKVKTFIIHPVHLKVL